MRTYFPICSFLICLFLGQTVLADSSLSSERSKKGEGSFLLLSDIHFDPYADKTLASQLAQAPVEQWDGIFNSSSSKAFAAYGKDVNYPLWISCLASIEKRTEPDYVIVSGDFLSHHFLEDFNQLIHGDRKAYTDFVTKTLAYVAGSLQKSLPGTPIYFCLGNNDSDCDDYEMTPRSAMLAPLKDCWETVAKNTQAQADFAEGGYYTVKHPTLRNQEFIVLNDVFWSAKYENACGQSDAEPGMVEMNWLKVKLDEARKAHLKVTVIDHMPIGINGYSASNRAEENKGPKTFWKEKFSSRYLKLMSFYRDVVRGMFSGHTHMDDFRVLTDTKGVPYLFDHITPAVSPVHHNNPGYQVMDYDRQSGMVEDMSTYYCDLSSPKSQWALEYRFDQDYGLNGYDPENLLHLSEKIQDDVKIRDKYISHAVVSSVDKPSANADNWQYFHCAQTKFDPTAYAHCAR